MQYNDFQTITKPNLATQNVEAVTTTGVTWRKAVSAMADLIGKSIRLNSRFPACGIQSQANPVLPSSQDQIEFDLDQQQNSEDH